MILRRLFLQATVISLMEYAGGALPAICLHGRRTLLLWSLLRSTYTVFYIIPVRMWEELLPASSRLLTHGLHNADLRAAN